MESKGRGVLDTPHARGMTTSCGVRLHSLFNSRRVRRSSTKRRRKRRSAASLIRFLPQLRVRAAEVGRGGILADLDDAAADGAGAGEMLEQRLAVAATDRARQLREVLVE